MAKTISVLEAARLVEEGSGVLLDVREQHEWIAVRADNALHIPMGELSTSTHRLPGRGTIACICHVGARSAVVAEALAGAGYDAVNVAGGMDAWEGAGLPVARG
ncbi:MAG TPA: rhodanese-like domain-containing protein [Mycobacteriales bacterium]|nr:rhodanese-like domain-containing protein [Mycobacteriales bacterium]